MPWFQLWKHRDFNFWSFHSRKYPDSNSGRFWISIFELQNFKSWPVRISIPDFRFSREISASFWYSGQIFCKWAKFLDRSNLFITTWGLTQLLNWFLRGGLIKPTPIHRIWTPSQVGLKSKVCFGSRSKSFEAGGSFFGVRPSIYVLKGCFNDAPQKLPKTSDI